MVARAPKNHADWCVSTASKARLTADHAQSQLRWLIGGTFPFQRGKQTTSKIFGPALNVGATCRLTLLNPVNHKPNRDKGAQEGLAAT
jgi:hypothetical protein